MTTKTKAKPSTSSKRFASPQKPGPLFTGTVTRQVNSGNRVELTIVFDADIPEESHNKDESVRRRQNRARAERQKAWEAFTDDYHLQGKEARIID